MLDYINGNFKSEGDMATKIISWVKHKHMKPIISDN